MPAQGILWMDRATFLCLKALKEGDRRPGDARIRRTAQFSSCHRSVVGGGATWTAPVR